MTKHILKYIAGLIIPSLIGRGFAVAGHIDIGLLINFWLGGALVLWMWWDFGDLKEIYRDWRDAEDED